MKAPPSRYMIGRIEKPKHQKKENSMYITRKMSKNYVLSSRFYFSKNKYEKWIIIKLKVCKETFEF